MRQKQNCAAVNQVVFGSAIARDATVRWRCQIPVDKMQYDVYAGWCSGQPLLLSFPQL